MGKMENTKEKIKSVEEECGVCAGKTFFEELTSCEGFVVRTLLLLQCGTTIKTTSVEDVCCYGGRTFMLECFSG